MPPRRSKANVEEDRWRKATAQISELEDRLRIMEAKMREVSAQLRAAATTPEAQKQARNAARRAARERPRLRCPGCTLELPKGRRSDFCVWCGFMLAAVRARTFR